MTNGVGRTVSRPARFLLDRHTDPSGVSGTGLVAWGVRWPDGTVAVRWPGEHPSTVAWASLEDAMAVHGHGGLTRLVWVDEPGDR